VDKNEIISSGLLELYALGLASQEEQLLVEEMLMKYPELKTELTDIEAGMESYARAYSVQPSAKTKQSLLSQINASSKTYDDDAATSDDVSYGKVVGISPAWKWIAAASIILLIGSGILNAIYYNKYLQSNSAYNAANEELASTKQALSEYDEEMSVVKDKNSLPVALTGLPAAPDAAAKIFWMKNTGEVYIDPSNLPAPPAGKQYQLWAIVDGKPVDGGMISINTAKGNKYSIQKMKSFGKAEAFAVTLEKEGGNPTPQGEMYVMGKM